MIKRWLKRLIRETMREEQFEANRRAYLKAYAEADVAHTLDLYDRPSGARITHASDGRTCKQINGFWYREQNGFIFGPCDREHEIIKLSDNG